MFNFIKEILKEPKAVRELSLLIIVLILLGIVYSSSKETNETNRLVSGALSENTAVVKQFQSLLLDVVADKAGSAEFKSTIARAIEGPEIVATSTHGKNIRN